MKEKKSTASSVVISGTRPSSLGTYAPTEQKEKGVIFDLTFALLLARN